MSKGPKQKSGWKAPLGAEPFQFHDADRSELVELLDETQTQGLEKVVAYAKDLQKNGWPRPLEIIAACNATQDAVGALLQQLQNIDELTVIHFAAAQFSLEDLTRLESDLSNLMSATQDAMASIDVKPGRPSDGAQKTLTNRVVEAFREKGIAITYYRNGPVVRVLDLCLKATGLQMADPLNLLRRYGVKTPRERDE